MGDEPRVRPESAHSEDAPATLIEAAVIRLEKYTDLGNANRFAVQYQDQYVHCAVWDKWLHWDRRRWAPDETRKVFDSAADLIRNMYSIAKSLKDENEAKALLKHLHKSESHRAINAMVTLAKSHAAIARHPNDFDNDPWLLTVQNGTIDLRTGQIRPSTPKDMITKLAAVRFDSAAQCSNWNSFLNMIMLDRPNLINFLKRAVGASLTGITRDKAMLIMYGPGGDNGKSTFIEVLEMLLGDYAARTPVETLFKKHDGGIPNDIARLKGARFVWATENDRGVRLAESLIKEMTGGDRMVARFLHGEFFEFMPEFKLWLATNHKPTIRGDAAIWRRLKLIPFDYTIPKEKQKKRDEVMAMFQAELSGILNWAIEGCMEWQRDGLGVPEEVITATQEYEAEQDTFSMFLEERCALVASQRTPGKVLYKTYREWAEQYGEMPVSHKTFASLMSERKFAKTKSMTGVIYQGIALQGIDHFDIPIVSSTRPNPHGVDQEQKGEEI